MGRHRRRGQGRCLLVLASTPIRPGGRGVWTGSCRWVSHPRSEAVQKITQALAGPAAFLHKAEPLPPRVAILYSRQSLLLYAADDPRATWTGDRVMLSLIGCHRALCERQIPVDFINEDAVKRGEAARYAVLYLPHCYALDDATVASLQALRGRRRHNLGRWPDRLERRLRQREARNARRPEGRVRPEGGRYRGHSRHISLDPARFL